MSNCNDLWNSKDKADTEVLHLVLACICPLVVVVAVAKEVHDAEIEGNHFCWKDIVADIIGVAVGSGLHAMLI